MTQRLDARAPGWRLRMRDQALWSVVLAQAQRMVHRVPGVGPNSQSFLHSNAERLASLAI